MKILILSAACLLGFVPAGMTQISHDGARPTEGVSVTSVDSAMSYAPGRVRIHGDNLRLVRDVRINGALVPIVQQGDKQIVIEPGDQDPGFALLQLAAPKTLVSEKIEFLPSLKARWHGARIQLTLHPGESGWFILNYSYRRAPQPIQYLNTYYMQMLDMTAHFSGQLAGGVFMTGEAVVFPTIPVPPLLDFAGIAAPAQAMNIQAYCLVGDDLCFSNMLTLQPSL